MLKRMLVLLGETPSSLAARHYSFLLAQQTGAELTGLSGIDLTAIEAPMPGVIGAHAFKVRLEEQLKQQVGHSACAYTRLSSRSAGSTTSHSNGCPLRVSPPCALFLYH